MSQAQNLPTPRPGGHVTNLAELRQQRAQAPAPVQRQEVRVSLDTEAGFALLEREGRMFCDSTLVPDQFRGNLANCMVALNMSQRLGADPMTVMQQLYIVHGKPAFSSAFLIATFNKSGRYSSISYEFFGEKGTKGYGCRAISTELATGDRITGPEVTIGMAEQEGWASKNGSKWRTMPDLMLRYRAAAFLIRTTAPEIAMGLHTVDEVRDAYDAEHRAPIPAQVVDEGPVEAPAPQATLKPVQQEASPAPDPKLSPKKRSAPKKEQAPVVDVQAEPAPAAPKKEAPIQQQAQAAPQAVGLHEAWEDFLDHVDCPSNISMEILRRYSASQGGNVDQAKIYYLDNKNDFVKTWKELENGK